MDPIRLSVFHELFTALAEEMGEVLHGTAPSVNIRERRDYSCALFDERGRLVSQAAHIPVHLGSAGLSVDAVRRHALEDGDAWLLNDPYAGGTHLPDLTLVTPVYLPGKALEGLPWFLVNRAHHSDIGGSQPGSMAPAADLPAEGLRIPPLPLIRRGEWQESLLQMILANTRTPDLRLGDLRAQVEANRLGERRLRELWSEQGAASCREAVDALLDYSARLLASSLQSLRAGRHRAVAMLEGDGVEDGDLNLRLELEVVEGHLRFDFAETDDQGPGCLNANPAITHAAVLYCLRCLAPADLPTNGGLLRDVEILTRKGSLCDPRFPAAVAGGNVETSQRLVDLCFAALGKAGARVPAESSGTMNNLSLGGFDHARGQAFAIYETIGGGAGAMDGLPGASAVQTHMTNTRNTPIEDLELTHPIVVEKYTVRRGSGGKASGRKRTGVGARGGDGLIKRIRSRERLQVSLLSERRRIAPTGREGGGPGRVGRQTVQGKPFPSKVSFVLEAGETLEIQTPGGGGC